MHEEVGPDGRTRTRWTTLTDEGWEEQLLSEAKFDAAVRAARALEAQRLQGTPPPAASTVLPTPSAAARAVTAAPLADPQQPPQPPKSQRPVLDVSPAFAPGHQPAHPVPVPAFATAEEPSKRTLPGHVRPPPAGVVYRPRRVRLEPTREQRPVLKAAHAAHRAVYNACVRVLNENRDSGQTTKLGELRDLGQRMHDPEDRAFVKCVADCPATVMYAAVEAAFSAAASCIAKAKKGGPRRWRLCEKKPSDKSVISLASQQNGGPIGEVTRVTERGTPGASRARAKISLFPNAWGRPPTQAEIDARLAARMTRQHATRNLVYPGRDIHFSDKPEVVNWMVEQEGRGCRGPLPTGVFAHGFKLEKIKGKHYLTVVAEVAKAVPPTPQQILTLRSAGADPGVKTALSIAIEDGLVEFGVGVAEWVAEVRLLQQHLKMLQGRAVAAHRAQAQALRLLKQSDPAAKRRDLPDVRPGSKSPQATARRLQRRLAALALKLTNRMKDLHYQWINRLFAECDVVVWPWLKTKQMLSRGGLLAPYTKDLCKALSHYKLMQRLWYKMEITQGKAVLWGAEPGTSKTCLVCGAINGKLGGLGLFYCNP